MSWKETGMRLLIPIAAALAALAVGACSKGAQSPRPEHSDVATAMPDAATTPGAQGPATVAPHAPPPAESNLPPAGAAGAPASGAPSPTASPATAPQ
jgi:hypothetical protein